MPDIYSSIGYNSVLDSASNDLARTLQLFQPNDADLLALRIVNSKGISLGRIPGRALELDNMKSLYGDARVFLQKQRLYGIDTFTSLKDKDDPVKQSYIQNFLDPLRLE